MLSLLYSFKLILYNKLKRYAICIAFTLNYQSDVNLVRRRLMTLDHCEVVLVHLTPVGEQSDITHKAKVEVIILFPQNSGDFLTLTFLFIKQILGNLKL